MMEWARWRVIFWVKICTRTVERRTADGHDGVLPRKKGSAGWNKRRFLTIRSSHCDDRRLRGRGCDNLGIHGKTGQPDTWRNRSLRVDSWLISGLGISMSTRPLIGLTTHPPDDEGHFHLSSLYVEAVRRAGGIAILLPPGDDRPDEILARLDGIIFTGGGDVEPALY